MKVKELISVLSTVDENKEIVVDVNGTSFYKSVGIKFSGNVVVITLKREN